MHSKQKKEIFANFTAFADLLETKPTLIEICRSLNSLKEFDTIEKVIIANEEHCNVNISFQRKVGMIMVLFKGVGKYDYFPIYRNEITMASMKQNEHHVS